MEPKKPHEHYYLEGDYKDEIAWEKGKTIKISKKTKGEYTLSQR